VFSLAAASSDNKFSVTLFCALDAAANLLQFQNELLVSFRQHSKEGSNTNRELTLLTASPLLIQTLCQLFTVVCVRCVDPVLENYSPETLRFCPAISDQTLRGILGYLPIFRATFVALFIVLIRSRIQSSCVFVVPNFARGFIIDSIGNWCITCCM
jgi:hypothetical protein